MRGEHGEGRDSADFTRYPFTVFFSTLFSDTEAPLELKRTVGLFSGISLIVGTMIGKIQMNLNMFNCGDGLCIEFFLFTSDAFYAGSGIFVSPTGLLDRSVD